MDQTPAERINESINIIRIGVLLVLVIMMIANIQLYFSSKISLKNQIKEYFSSDVPLTDYELKSLFPKYQSDWDFIQNLVGVKNLKLPPIYYQKNTSLNDLESDGTYYSFETFNVISLVRSLFATTTTYARYVMLHEMAHAAISRYSGYNDTEGQHCYMVRKGIFRAIGERIGNQGIGLNEEASHIKMYNCKNI